VVVDAQTFLVPQFSYDGQAPGEPDVQYYFPLLPHFIFWNDNLDIVWWPVLNRGLGVLDLVPKASSSYRLFSMLFRSYAVNILVDQILHYPKRIYIVVGIRSLGRNPSGNDIHTNCLFYLFSSQTQLSMNNYKLFRFFSAFSLSISPIWELIPKNSEFKYCIVRSDSAFNSTSEPIYGL
jgi:hypothetical protein